MESLPTNPHQPYANPLMRLGKRRIFSYSRTATVVLLAILRIGIKKLSLKNFRALSPMPRRENGCEENRVFVLTNKNTRVAACGGPRREHPRTTAGLRGARLRPAQSCGLRTTASHRQAKELSGMAERTLGSAAVCSPTAEGASERRASCSPPQWGGGKLRG